MKDKPQQPEATIHQKFPMCSVVKYLVIGSVLFSYFLLDYLSISFTLKSLMERNRIFRVIIERNQYMYFIRYFADENIYGRDLFEKERPLFNLTKQHISDIYENDRNIQGLKA